MDFFGIGILEIIVVLLIALIVVGPQRLPQMAFKLGHIMRRLRMVTAEMTRSISDEVNQETRDLQPDVQEFKEITADTEDAPKEEKDQQSS